MASPPSHAQSVLPDPKALVLDRIERVENRFILSVHGRQAPRCPRCSRVSSSPHSSYVRNVQDLPWQGLAVQIRLKVRRFRCRNRNCGQKIFSERLSGIVRAYGHRSDRLGDIVRLIGYSLGGLPASRILERLAVPISDDTVLREVKHSDAAAPAEALRHVGVDDWAWRKGHTYGTILVDLERHKVIELLPDRSAESVQRWLEDHPGIATINRDRCGLYADGASRGAPDVVQIADRFHLALNLSAAIERALDEHRDCLQLSASGDTVERTDQTPTRHEAGSLPERRKQQNRQNRLERYETVMDLHRRGHTQRSISETVGLSLKTVRRWLRRSTFQSGSPSSRGTAMWVSFVITSESDGNRDAITRPSYSGKSARAVIAAAAKWSLITYQAGADPALLLGETGAFLRRKPPSSSASSRNCERICNRICFAG